MSDRRQQTDIPSSTDELLAAGRSKVGEGRLNLRGLAPVGPDDDATERNVQEITQSYGAHAQIPPAKDKSSKGTRSVAAARHAQQQVVIPRTKYASFRIDLPEYLDHELTMRAARDRVTKGYLVLDALRRAGFLVQTEDLVADRRKTRWRTE